MAVITYGVNINESTWETNGDWRSLDKYAALLRMLDEGGYVAPTVLANPFQQKKSPTELLYPITEATGQERDLEALLEKRHNGKKIETTLKGAVCCRYN